MTCGRSSPGSARSIRLRRAPKASRLLSKQGLIGTLYPRASGLSGRSGAERPTHPKPGSYSPSFVRCRGCAAIAEFKSDIYSPRDQDILTLNDAIEKTPIASPEDLK